MNTRWSLIGLGLALLASPPSSAAEQAADPTSAVGKAGTVILQAVAGRSYHDAFVKSQSPVNPFGIDLAAVARAVGATPRGGELGANAAEGQLSILPQYNTPASQFGDSSVTPAIIPFAFMLGGICQGGYVTGFPTADKVVSVDMGGRDCSAAAIAGSLVAPYTTALAAAKAEVARVADADAAKVDRPMPAEPSTTAAADAKGFGMPAPKGSDVDRVGQVILAAVAGRTVDAALGDGNEADNPFGLDAEPLLLAAGVYFLNSDTSGKPIEASELSIYADYATPGGLFKPSVLTPPILPYAFNRGGVCQGGYVSGFPVANAVYALDMKGRACNAKTIDDVVNAQYHMLSAETAVPAGDQDNAQSGEVASAANAGDADAKVADSSTTAPAPAGDDAVFDGISASDHDLEMIVYGAYTGAYSQALKHGNYFQSSDLPYDKLRTAVRDALEKEGYGAASVATAPAASAPDAKACASDGHIDLRFAFNNDGVGVAVVAVSDKRMSAYEYDPTNGSGLVITHADDCLATTAAPSTGHSTKPDRLKTPAH